MAFEKLIFLSLFVTYVMAATYLVVPVPVSQGNGYEENVLMKRWGNLNFKKPAFWSALTNREDTQQGLVSDSQLLPEHLLHEEFLRPQLQAAGFKGGRIIAGPFPVPLSKLPKPPGVSGPVPQPQPQPQQIQPLGAATAKATSGNVIVVSKPSHKPVQQVNPAPYQPAAQFVLPNNNQRATFKPSLPAATVSYQAVKPNAIYSPVTVSEEQRSSASNQAAVKLSYGGWTPIYGQVDNAATLDEAQQTNAELTASSRRTAKAKKFIRTPENLADLGDVKEQQVPEDIITASSLQTPFQKIGGGQGRFVGRVLPDSPRGSRLNSVPTSKWEQTRDNMSVSSVGYVLRFAERR